MHVVVATDGSPQSLDAARQLKSFADPTKIDEVTVVAVLSPLASVPFVNELGGVAGSRVAAGDLTGLSFSDEAAAAVAVVAAEFDTWVPTVHRQIRSGSPAAQIVETAEEVGAGLVVVASGSRGLSERVLLGSTAQRVQHSAPCPVLVSRPLRS